MSDQTNVQQDSRATQEPLVSKANVVCQVVRSKDEDGQINLHLRWSEKGGFFRAYPLNIQKQDKIVGDLRTAILGLIYYYSAVDSSLFNMRDKKLLGILADISEKGKELYFWLFPRENLKNHLEEEVNLVRDWLARLTENNQIESLEIQQDDQVYDSKEPFPDIPWNFVFADSVLDEEDLEESFHGSSVYDSFWKGFWGVRYNLSCGRNVNPLKRDAQIDSKQLTLIIVQDQEVVSKVNQETAKIRSLLLEKQEALKKQLESGPGQADQKGKQLELNQIEGKLSFLARVPDLNQLKEALDNQIVREGSEGMAITFQSWKDLKRHLKQNDPPDLLYWIGHAQNNELQLDNDSRSIQDIKSWFREGIELKKSKPKLHSLGFFNGCNTAVASEGGTYLQTFIDGNILSGMIGTEKETPAIFAYWFGAQFLFEFLLKSRPVGQILTDLRRRSLPLGLLYGSYCPPQVRLGWRVPLADEEATPESFHGAGNLGALLGGGALLGETSEREIPSPTAPGSAASGGETLSWPEKPYPSLGFYTVKDQALFMGRDDDVSRLAELLDRPQTRILMVHGTSGSGKSSVIRAGLIPYLEEYAVGYRFPRISDSAAVIGVEKEPIHLFLRPSDNFVGRLADVLLAFVNEPYANKGKPNGQRWEPIHLDKVLTEVLSVTACPTQQELKAALVQIPELLCKILDVITDEVPEKLVLFIDQMEELFTLASTETHEAIRDTAFSLLKSCQNGNGRWRIVLGYRTEYHGRISDGLRSGTRSVPGLVDYLITDLRKEQLRKVIERPTLDYPVVEGLPSPRSVYGFHYEEALVNEIVDGIFALRGRNTDSVLPLAQVVCIQLWEKAKERSAADGPSAPLTGIQIRMEDYQSLVRREDHLPTDPMKSTAEEKILPILEGHALRAIKKVAAGDSALEHGLKDLMMGLYLRQPDGTLTTAQMSMAKLRTEEPWIDQPAILESVLNRATQDRIFRVDSATGAKETEERYIRLGHDALAKVANVWKAKKEKELLEREKEEKLARLRETVRWFAGGGLACALLMVMALYQSFEADTQRKYAKISEKEAIKQKKIADEKKNAALDAQSKAMESQALAMQEKQKASKNLLVSESRLHANRINTAQAEWDYGSPHIAYDVMNSIDWNQRHFEYRYLHKITHPELHTFNGHSGFVNNVAIRQDGKRIVSASDDNTLKVWDTDSGQECITLQGHDKPVMSGSFSPDGKQILSASADHTLRLWDADSGVQIFVFKGHTDRVNCGSFSPDGKQIISASDDCTLKVWDADSRQILITLQGHDKPVTSGSFSPDGKRILSASADHTLKLWDAASGLELRTYKGHSGRVNSGCFNPDGSRIVSASADNTLKVWDADSRQEHITFKGHSKSVNNAAFSPNCNWICSAGDDMTLRIWDAYSGSEIHTFKGHKSYVRSGIFSSDGKKLVSTSNDNTIKIWDARKNSNNTLIGHSSGVRSICFNRDGSQVCSAGNDQNIKIWDIKTGNVLHTFKGHEAPVRSIGFSPVDNKIISASDDRTLRIWDAINGNTLHILQGHSGGVWSGSFSPDGSGVISASADGTLKLWDSKTGNLLNTFIGHRQGVRSGAFSPDGLRVVSASDDGTLKVWDTQTGQKILELTGHSDGIRSAAFSPDGLWILSASDDKTLKIWDAQTGQERFALKGHKEWLSGGSFSPDGKRIVSSSFDQALKIWDAQTGQEIITIKGHGNGITCSAFSHDGEMIVSGDFDGIIKVWDGRYKCDDLTIKCKSSSINSGLFFSDGRSIISANGDRSLIIWDAESGKEALKINGHKNGVNDVAVSSNGKSIVSCGDDNSVIIWDANTWKVRMVINGHKREVNSCKFSRDNSLVASASDDGALKIFDSSTGNELLSLQGHEGFVNDCSFSFDGKRVLSAGSDMTIRVWDIESGVEVLKINGHLDGVTSCTFSRDDKIILSSSLDKTLRLWDAGTGRQLLILKGHKGAVNHGVFSADGKRILSASTDKTLKIWDASIGRELFTIKGHTGTVNRGVFSPDERKILSVSLDESIKLWDLPSHKLAVPYSQYVVSAPWHESQAQESSEIGNGFAEAFHLERLYLCKQDPETKQRLLKAFEKAKPSPGLEVLKRRHQEFDRDLQQAIKDQ